MEDGQVQLGHAGAGGVIAAVNTGRIAEQNPFGVSGARWIASDPGKPKPVGCGQHGGWGSDETQPFLIVNHPDVPVGIRTLPSSLVDIAATLLAFLGLPIRAGTPDGKPRWEPSDGR